MPGPDSFWAPLFAAFAWGCSASVASPALDPAPDPNAFRLQVPSAGPVPSVAEPVPAEVPLPNGFRLLYVPWDSGTTALEVRCRAGAAGDPVGRSGVSSLLGRMLTEGTESQSAFEQAVAFEDLGASLHHDAGAETLGLSTEVRPEDLERAVQLLGEALLAPGLREADFARVRRERLDDLKAARQDPEQVAWLLAQRAVLGPQRGRPTAGSPSDVRATTVDDLRTRHLEAIAPERCALLAAGTFSPVHLEAFVRARFGSWQAESDAPSLPDPAPARSGHSGRVLWLERADAVQSALVAGRLVPGRLDAAYEAREVVDRAFGGLFTSRLNTNLRERHGFTYGAFSNLVAYRDVGVWYLASSVHAEHTAPAVLELHREILRLQAEPLLPEEVTRARADLVERRRARLEHDTLLLATLREPFTFGLPLGHARGYAERLGALGPTALADASRSLGDGAFVTVVVATREQAGALGSQGFEVVEADPSWLE